MIVFLQDNSVEYSSFSTKELLLTPGRKMSQHGTSAVAQTGVSRSAAPASQHPSVSPAASSPISSSSLAPVRKISDEEKQLILVDDRLLHFSSMLLFTSSAHSNLTYSTTFFAISPPASRSKLQWGKKLLSILKNSMNAKVCDSSQWWTSKVQC